MFPFFLINEFLKKDLTVNRQLPVPELVEGSTFFFRRIVDIHMNLHVDRSDPIPGASAEQDW
jgi:hypothetical protein